MKSSLYSLGTVFSLELCFLTCDVGEAEVWTLWSGQEPGSGAQQPGSTTGHVLLGPFTAPCEFPPRENVCKSLRVMCVQASALP